MGLEALETGSGRTSGASGINPFSRDLNYINLSTIEPNPPFSSYAVPSRFYSTFGQVNYNWDERYYVTAVVRRDQSSRFGANQRSGTFPLLLGCLARNGGAFHGESELLHRPEDSGWLRRDG